VSKRNVFMWHKCFREGREDVNDDERQGAPITKQTGENVMKIGEIVWSDCQLIYRMIADEFDMSKETVRKIFVQDLGMRKLATKHVPQTWQRNRRIDISLCAWTLWNNFKKIIFWIMSSLVIKHGVISMIPRPNASPWSGDQKIPQCQRSHGC
jgi:hypothetical protein